MSKEIKDLEIIEKDLEEKVKKLRIEESNLKSFIHTETMRIEAQKKLDEVNLTKKENLGKMGLDAKEAKIFDREKIVERSETALKDRIIMVEKREQEHIYLEKKFEQLNKERKDFEIMKRNQMVELDKIKEETEIYKAKSEELKLREDNIRGREKALIEKEMYYQNELGRLGEWEKQIKTQVEHLEGLKKEIQYVG